MAEIAHPANARSRRTRSRLLDATRELLEDGVHALTMAAVAERAGVSRGAAYLHFESRADLLAALFDHLAERNHLAESMAPVWAAPDASTALDEWARHLARHHPPMITVDRAIQQLQRLDDDIAQHRRRVIQAQLRTCRRLARWLADDGVLAPEWTVETAADLIYGLIATDLIDRLITDRAWSLDDLARHLSVMLRRTLTFSASPPPDPAGGPVAGPAVGPVHR
jgi:AcrR family transcriptional regulator